MLLNRELANLATSIALVGLKRESENAGKIAPRELKRRAAEENGQRIFPELLYDQRYAHKFKHINIISKKI